MSVTRPGFHDHLRQAREQADQTPEVMAVLLNLSIEDYRAIEAGERFPDDETLRRLCLMLEWNYYETRRAINNTGSKPSGGAEGTAKTIARPTAPVSNKAAEKAAQALTGQPLESGKSGRKDTLGQRMAEVREQTGQSLEVIAMLLGLTPESYMLLEGGELPDDELLRKISMVYDWNFHDLKALLRSEQALALQPRRYGVPFAGASTHSHRVKSVLNELETQFPHLGNREQEFCLAQLELVLETVKRQRGTTRAVPHSA
ncbi:MAG: transcriptional regulator [Deltaproteobacteria bacterium]|nr:transcriptional regulator [Deltaproteobacteria bacterium]